MNKKYILLAVAILLGFTVFAQPGKPAGKPKTTTTKTPAKTSTTTAATAENPKFCTTLKKIVEASKTNFADLMGDTIRAKKTIIVASKIDLPGVTVNRISIDPTVKLYFFNAYFEGQGNLLSTKAKYDALKKQVKTCLAANKWNERETRTDTKEEFSCSYFLTENKLDPKTKDLKGISVELIVDADVNDTEYSIILTVTKY